MQARAKHIGRGVDADSHNQRHAGRIRRLFAFPADEFNALGMIGSISNNSLPFQSILRRNMNEQNQIMTRLATGKRINAGKDDPAGLIAATDLEAAIKALEAESRSLQRVNSNANVTDGHMAQLTSMMGDLRELVVAGANTGGLSDAEISANQMQIDHLTASIQSFTYDAVGSLDGISLADGGAEAMAQTLNDAAASLTALTSGGASSLAGGDFSAMETIVSDATTAFAEARGTVGAYQKYDVETRLSNIESERENLMSSLSRIVDTDYAEETSNLARSKVMTAASISVLKIANQNAATVLNLLS